MITGGQKYFEQNKALFGLGTIISATTGTGEFGLDQNNFTFLRSVGSDDTTTETYTITFNSTVSINRFLARDINWKEFTVKYDPGSGTFTDFSSVVGLDATSATIAETTFADDTAYFEFDLVSAVRLEITVTKTQVANEEKYVNEIIATKELGTFEGFPIVGAITYSRNQKETRTLGGRIIVQKSIETISFGVSMDSYPAGLTADLDLAYTLLDQEAPFMVWLCGGRRGATYFKYTIRGFRLKDLFQVQIQGNITAAYKKSIYVLPVNVKYQLTEAV